VLRRIALLYVCLAAAGCGALTGSKAPRQPRRRGLAAAEHGRPKHFPHRIWAFSGFEARPPSFGWFGATERNNIPDYPGNTAARRGTPLKKWAALKTGMNPVPGPRMGAVNKLYVRYYLKGTDAARFQHYSLSSGDNCNVLVSGLEQGEWAETVMNFTRDSRRNDGSPGAFKKGERMDDLQVYVGKPGTGKKYEIIIDDAIFFAEEPGAPPEPEPFPRRVIFLAAFDTGIGGKAKKTFYPGSFAAVHGGQAPADSYWAVAKAVKQDPKDKRPVLTVSLDMNPARPVGPNTRARFRYWVSGAETIQVSLSDDTAKESHAVKVEGCEQKKWATQYVKFSAGERTPDGRKLPVGTKLGRIAFQVPYKPGAELYVDEVVVYDAPGK
jgi:hypothetical protein